MNDHAATIRNLEDRLVDADADLAAVTAAAEQLREQLTTAQEEREAWKHKYKTLHNELMCELRDPCGTIWEHAKMLQDKYEAQVKEIAELKARIAAGQQ